MTAEVGEDILQKECLRRKISEIKVYYDELPDARMQNIALLKAVDRNQLIPGIIRVHYQASMKDLMEGEMLKKNMAFFV